MCFENARRNPCNFTGSGQLSKFGTGWLFQTAILYATLLIKADISLENSGASNCWTRRTRQMKDAIGDLQDGTVYRSDLLQCRKLNIFNRLQAVWREAHGQDPCSS